MRRDDLRLRNGIGWVSAQRRRVVSPPAGADDLAFYVIDTPRAVAVVKNEQSFQGSDREEAAARLLAAHFPVVVFIGPDAPGAAVAHCFSDLEDAIEEAACGIWALKALGGWDESSPMTFLITHLAEIDRAERAVTVRSHHAVWVTVRSKSYSNRQTIEIQRLRPGGWDVLREELRVRSPSNGAIVIGDVDSSLAYNDAYGHEVGDLMLARVQASLHPGRRRRLRAARRDVRRRNARRDGHKERRRGDEHPVRASERSNARPGDHLRRDG